MKIHLETADGRTEVLNMLLVHIFWTCAFLTDNLKVKYVRVLLPYPFFRQSQSEICKGTYHLRFFQYELTSNTEINEKLTCLPNSAEHSQTHHTFPTVIGGNFRISISCQAFLFITAPTIYDFWKKFSGV